MPVSMEIRENGHVIYFLVTDPWQVSELAPLYAEENSYRDTVNFKVHTFLNFSQVNHIPTQIMSAKRGAPDPTHPSSGVIILVGAKSFVKIMLEVILRLTHFERVRLFDTEAEGWAFTRQIIAEETPSTT